MKDFPTVTRRTMAWLLVVAATGCGPGLATSGGALEPWTGPTVEVTQAEGNTLAPGTAYHGSWAGTTYFMFDFELEGMAAMKVTALDDRGEAKDLDVKLFSNYLEMYTTVGASMHNGRYAFRLPAGKYSLSIQLAPGVEPGGPGWNLRIEDVQGKEALAIHVPQAALEKGHQSFKGNVLNLQGALSDEPSFVDMMQAWLYVSAPDYASFVKPGATLYPAGSDAAVVFAQDRSKGLELLPGEPVVVYELYDLFGARIITADGLYGILNVEDFLISPPGIVRIPDSFRVADGYRMIAPDSEHPSRNGGELALISKIEGSKELKKQYKCLDPALADPDGQMAELRLVLIAMAPGDPGYDEMLAQYRALVAAQEEKIDVCLAPAWDSIGTFISDADRLVAAFGILASIEKAFGIAPAAIPGTLPPVFASLVPPPPPPPPPEPVAPPPPPPAQPAPVVATAPAKPAPVVATAPVKPPAQPAAQPAPPAQPAQPPAQPAAQPAPPAQPAQPPAQPAPAPAHQPTPPPPPPPAQPAPPPPPPAPPPPPPPQWNPIIPWAHVDGK